MCAGWLLPEALEQPKDGRSGAGRQEAAPQSRGALEVGADRRKVKEV